MGVIQPPIGHIYGYRLEPDRRRHAGDQLLRLVDDRPGVERARHLPDHPRDRAARHARHPRPHGQARLPEALGRAYSRPRFPHAGGRGMEVDKHDNGVPGWVDLGSPDLDAAPRVLQRAVRLGHPARPGGSGRLQHRDAARKAGRRHGPRDEPWPARVGDLRHRRQRRTTSRRRSRRTEAPRSSSRWTCSTRGAWPSSSIRKGAVFSAWQAGIMPGAGIVNEPNSYSWSELVTSDIDASKKFYGAVFGWGGRDLRRGRGPDGRLHRVEDRRPLGRRHDVASTAAARRGAELLGRVLRGRRHRGHRRAS